MPKTSLFKYVSEFWIFLDGDILDKCDRSGLANDDDGGDRTSFDGRFMPIGPRI